MATYHVAWWNVENLFDEEGTERRSDKLARALGSSIQGWTAELRDQKIDQLASVIAAMNNDTGPDLLGVCEVENEFVLGRLATALNRLVPARRYEVVHADTIDRRGIDIAFLYDPELFAAPADQRFQHVVMRRTATREIFQVNFQTTSGRTWAVFGNHWPSRSGGQLESAPYRAIAGETLAYFHQRVLQVHGVDTPVLVMGDFNDEPFDPSLLQHALSTRQPAKVLGASSAPRLLNLMWPALADGGTFYWQNFANLLDQFLINKNMIRPSSPIHVDPASVQILTPPEMVNRGTYPSPVPFGGMGKPVNTDGYSDHFPIHLLAHESE